MNNELDDFWTHKMLKELRMLLIQEVAHRINHWWKWEPFLTITPPRDTSLGEVEKWVLRQGDVVIEGNLARVLAKRYFTEMGYYKSAAKEGVEIIQEDRKCCINCTHCLVYEKTDPPSSEILYLECREGPPTVHQANHRTGDLPVIWIDQPSFWPVITSWGYCDKFLDVNTCPQTRV